MALLHMYPDQTLYIYIILHTLIWLHLYSFVPGTQLYGSRPLYGVCLHCLIAHISIRLALFFFWKGACMNIESVNGSRLDPEQATPEKG